MTKGNKYAVGAATVAAECDYNPDGTYTTQEGEIAAYGASEASQTCATR